MAGLIVGMDLCDDYSQISVFNGKLLDAEAVGTTGEENSCMIPSVVCKQKGGEKWFIGEEAYRFALQGEGTMVDKPVKLLSKQGTATIEGVKYTAEDLVRIFVEQMLALAKKRYEETEVASLVITFQKKDAVVMDSLVRIMDRIGIEREKVHMINHAEAFLFYVLSQKKEIWANQTCLFDLTADGLHYYELNVMRGRRPQVAEVAHESLEEGFSLEILDSVSGGKLADKILCSCAERQLNKKLVTTAFLTGKGFETTEWASGFLKIICNKRRVFSGQSLFARGASFLAYDYLQEISAYPYVCLCEGRVPAAVSMQVKHEGRERQLIVVSAGSNWYEAKTSVDFILDDTHSVDFTVTPVRGPGQKRYSLSLDEFPARPNKTTRVQVIFSFSGDKEMTVRVIDKGFGDFFPESGRMIRQDYSI
ncbi:MAG: hypothetical protein HFI93_08095 [Lachnospiraceae bacterium]|nr:hypothetical protein [Lachnospiraceae bacterium]